MMDRYAAHVYVEDRKQRLGFSEFRPEWQLHTLCIDNSQHRAVAVARDIVEHRSNDYYTSEMVQGALHGFGVLSAMCRDELLAMESLYVRVGPIQPITDWRGYVKMRELAELYDKAIAALRNYADAQQ